MREREKELHAGFSKWAEALAEPPEFPGARFYLPHSLSHVVLTALSLECGYAASAIRERLYCSLPNDPVSMAGILLATGSSGTEGTLGGLVEQGRHVARHLCAAWDLGAPCSNDPVCGHHSPREEQTGRLLEGPHATLALLLTLRLGPVVAPGQGGQEVTPVAEVPMAEVTTPPAPAVTAQTPPRWRRGSSAPRHRTNGAPF